MILSHWSDQPIIKAHSVEQHKELDRGFKPNGLWVSVDGENDWKWWCEAESFRDLNKQFHYRVKLFMTHDVKIIDNYDDLHKFAEEYTREMIAYPRLPDLYKIDWQKVATAHQGLIIAPYIWEARLENDSMWYYPWDCASGCIWDEKAISGIELIRNPVGMAA